MVWVVRMLSSLMNLICTGSMLYSIYNETIPVNGLRVWTQLLSGESNIIATGRLQENGIMAGVFPV